MIYWRGLQQVVIRRADDKLQVLSGRTDVLFCVRIGSVEGGLLKDQWVSGCQERQERLRHQRGVKQK